MTCLRLHLQLTSLLDGLHGRLTACRARIFPNPPPRSPCHHSGPRGPPGQADRAGLRRPRGHPTSWAATGRCQPWPPAGTKQSRIPELRAARDRVRQLEQEIAILRRAATRLNEQGEVPPKRARPVIDRLVDAGAPCTPGVACWRFPSGLLPLLDAPHQRHRAPPPLAHRPNPRAPSCLSRHLRTPPHPRRAHLRHEHLLLEPAGLGRDDSRENRRHPRAHPHQAPQRPCHSR